MGLISSFVDSIPVTIGGDGDGKEPHTWEDPDKDGFLRRRIPDSPRGKAAFYSSLTLAVGMFVYIARFFPTSEVLVTTILLAGYPMVWYVSRKRAFRDIKRLDWSILYDGESGVTVRFGQAEGAGDVQLKTDEIWDDGKVFKPARELSLSGRVNPLRVKDIFARDDVRAKLHRTGETGETPVRDYLPNGHTAHVETDTIGDVYVTLTEGLSKVPKSPDIDRTCDDPNLIPRRQAGTIKSAYATMAEVQLPELQTKYERMRDRAEELARPTQEIVEERLEDAMQIAQARDVSRREAARIATQKHIEQTGGMPRDSEVDALESEISDELDDDE